MHLLLQTNDPSEIRQFSGANHEIMESFPHSSDAAGIEIWGSDLSDPLNFVEVRLVGNSGNLIHSRQVLDC